jgi:hypothetical protein
MLHRKLFARHRNSSTYTVCPADVRSIASRLGVGRPRLISVGRLGVVAHQVVEAAIAAERQVLQQPEQHLKAAEPTVETGNDQPASLSAKLVCAHSAALTAALVLKDNDEKTLITAGKLSAPQGFLERLTRDSQW